MATTDLTLTLVYEDATSRNVTLTDLPSSATPSTVASKAITFNQSLADTTSSARAAYRETFISDNGAPIVSISKATHTTTEETVIYNG